MSAKLDAALVLLNTARDFIAAEAAESDGPLMQRAQLSIALAVEATERAVEERKQ